MLKPYELKPFERHCDATNCDGTCQYSDCPIEKAAQKKLLKHILHIFNGHWDEWQELLKDFGIEKC